jgi:hypothetical protein
MYGIKSKNDVIFLLAVATYVCLCILSLWWLLALPVGLLAAIILPNSRIAGWRSRGDK